MAGGLRDSPNRHLGERQQVILLDLDQGFRTEPATTEELAAAEG
jgi:hypothetical protein